MSNWMITEDKLSVKQKDFINSEKMIDKNIWIKGFAGSGKSVLLVHSIANKILQNSNISICVVVFTHSLIQMFTAGMKELNIPEKNVYLTTYHQFKKNTMHYDYIFCDEVQDLTPSILEQMTKQAKKIILAGDSNQSIYLNDPATKELTLTTLDISNIVHPYNNIIDEIYRFSKSIQKVVAKFLPALEKVPNKTKNDINVILGNSITKEKEIEYVISKAEGSIITDNSVVILLPSHNDIVDFINNILKIKEITEWNIVKNHWGKIDFNALNWYLQKNNINIEYIGNGTGDLYNSNQVGKIVIMTYHSVKGLDFDSVFLPSLTSELYISSETLFMVAMTRSKLNLYLTYSGNNKHHFLNDIEKECHKLDIDSIYNIDKNESDLDDFDF